MPGIHATVESIRGTLVRVTPPASRRPAVRPEDRTIGPRALVLLVGLLALLPAVTVDMYLPSLPVVADELRTTHAAAQFTITGMLVGGAVGQLLVGPLSDRLGRRRPVLVGLALHVVLSLLCLVAGSIGQLATLRVLQGLGTASATVSAMAIVRDTWTGAEAARILSRLMLVIAVAPLLAPTVGSAVADLWGWRAVFGTLAVLGTALLLLVLRRLPETLPPHRRSAGAVAVVRTYPTLLRDGRFVALAVIPGMSMALVMSYVAGSTFVFQTEYGLTPQQFALVFAVGGTSLVTGSQVNAALVRRVGPLRLLRVGLPVTVALAAVAVAVAQARLGVVALVGAIWFTTSALGFVIANASALALSRHGERAGAAAAVIGFFQAGLAGSVSPLVGVLGGDGVAMTAVMLGSVAVALVVLALGTPAYRRGGWLAFDTPTSPAAESGPDPSATGPDPSATGPGPSATGEARGTGTDAPTGPAGTSSGRSARGSDPGRRTGPTG